MQDKWTSLEVTKLFKIKMATLKELQSDKFGYFKPDFYNGQGKQAYYSAKNLFQFQVYESTRELGINRKQVFLFNEWVSNIFKHFPKDSNFVSGTFDLSKPLLESNHRWVECYILNLQGKIPCSLLVHSEFDPEELLRNRKVKSSRLFEPLQVLVGNESRITKKMIEDEIWSEPVALTLNFTNISRLLREKLNRK